MSGPVEVGEGRLTDVAGLLPQAEVAGVEATVLVGELAGARSPARSDSPLIGGVPFEEPILMWWNFVARNKEEMAQARQDWEDASDRFGAVESQLGRIGAPPPLWNRPGMQPAQD